MAVGRHLARIFGIRFGRSILFQKFQVLQENAVYKNLGLFVFVFIAAHVRADCTCKTAKLENGWCAGCKLGHVAGLAVNSKKLWGQVAASPNAGETFKCEMCKKLAEAGNGYCETCNVGYIGKNHYHSKAGYVLARGEPVDPSKVQCEDCQKNLGGVVWCEKCKAGVIGYALYKDRVQFDAASQARANVSIAAGTKCENCQMAVLNDGKCLKCKRAFKEGNALELKEESPKDAKPAGVSQNNDKP